MKSMEEIPESGRAYQQEIYRYVEEITEGLMEKEQDEISGRLSQEYGIDFYPAESASVTNQEYMLVTFGLSGILSDEYGGDDKIFFDNMEERFREFGDNLSNFGSQYGKKHMVQYARLYSKIAEKEEITLDHPVETLVLQDVDEARGTVREILVDLSEKL